MAGGVGMRLWPLSRANRPKQLLRLFGGKSLLRESYERLAGLFDPKQISVITADHHLDLVSKELPELPTENLFGEPIGRDTANAVGLASSILAKRDPQAVVGIFTADHIITPHDRFRHAVERAFQVAEKQPDSLVTIGVRPSRPDTNYGYIHRGTPLSNGIFHVQRFAEKPNVAAAMKCLAGGEYYWNSGMFVWRAETILRQLSKHLPQSHVAVLELASVWGTDSGRRRLQEIYPTLLRISIDFAVLERAENVMVVEMDCHWVDVGSWPALEAVVHADGDGNINVNAAGQTMHLGSRGNIVVSDEGHLIATIGVDDLVIAHSSDATLICTKRDATGIKELLDNIKRQFGERYA